MVGNYSIFDFGELLFIFLTLQSSILNTGWFFWDDTAVSDLKSTDIRRNINTFHFFEGISPSATME